MFEVRSENVELITRAEAVPEVQLLFMEEMVLERRGHATSSQRFVD